MRERRTSRSDLPLEAVRLQLEYVAKEFGLVALFVADPDGLLIGTSHSSVNTEALAAYAPLDEGAEESVWRAAPEAPDGHAVNLVPFQVGSDRFVLGAVSNGEPAPADHPGIARAIGGVQRILAM